MQSYFEERLAIFITKNKSRVPISLPHRSGVPQFLSKLTFHSFVPVCSNLTTERCDFSAKNAAQDQGKQFFSWKKTRLPRKKRQVISEQVCQDDIQSSLNLVLIRLMVGWKIVAPHFRPIKNKLDPLATSPHAISRAWRREQEFAMRFDWFIWWSVWNLTAHVQLLQPYLYMITFLRQREVNSLFFQVFCSQNNLGLTVYDHPN